VFGNARTAYTHGTVVVAAPEALVLRHPHGAGRRLQEAEEVVRAVRPHDRAAHQVDRPEAEARRDVGDGAVFVQDEVVHAVVRLGLDGLGLELERGHLAPLLAEEDVHLEVRAKKSAAIRSEL
jgi:hypothetical protein